jgi:S1-C subfamily serine protease
MTRAVAVLALVVLGAGVGVAYPWERNSSLPPPSIYVPWPPPVVVDTARAQEPGQAPGPKEPETKPPKDFDGPGLYEKCVRSTVFIVTPLKGGSAQGSGTLIDAEKRYVLTNYHVVDEVDNVFVQFPVRNKDGSLMTDKKKYVDRIPAGAALKGKVLYRDDTRDLALIQLDKLPPDTKALPLAKKSVRTGEPVINIGNPGAVDWTFSTTSGNVRGVGVADMVVGRGGGAGVLRIKAWMVTVTNPINPGDSGGPLIDRRGYLVGVTESGRVGAQNVNNCVDVTEVRDFLKEKKITIKDLTGEKEEAPAPKPKHGLDSDRPKMLPTSPKGETGTEHPPKADKTADEKAAAELLQRAKLFENEDDKAYFKAKLKAIIASYPETAAGKEAKKLLDALK